MSGGDHERSPPGSNPTNAPHVGHVMSCTYFLQIPGAGTHGVVFASPLNEASPAERATYKPGLQPSKNLLRSNAASLRSHHAEAELETAETGAARKQSDDGERRGRVDEGKSGDISFWFSLLLAFDHDHDNELTFDQFARALTAATSKLEQSGFTITEDEKADIWLAVTGDRW